MELETPLEGTFVVDVSSGIAGGYATKILADGGAEVVKIEIEAGDPLRHRTITGAPIAPGEDGALFKYLSASKRSVVVDPRSSEDRLLLDHLLTAADLIVWSEESAPATVLDLSPDEIRRRAPLAIVAAISAFGLDGPWAGRPATPATLEAWSGGPAQRGRVDRSPVLQGGEPSEWVAGTYAALGLLLALYRREQPVQGELLDISKLEALVLTQVMHPRTYLSLAGVPWWSGRQPTVPEIHPTQDGYVGFMVVTGQQWLDFCALVEQPEWAERDELFNMARRGQLRDELVAGINAWTSKHTTEEATELASLLRVPATPVATGASSPGLDHFAARHFFTKSPGGDFTQPEVPYTLSGGATRRPFEPAPRCGEHTEEYRKRVRDGELDRVPGSDAPPAGSDPMGSLHVADFTQFWAGNSITHPLSMVGADVIHVESTAHPDGARTSNVRPPGQPLWWEYGPFFQAMATNKRGITLDMDSEEGRDLAHRLVERSGVLVENYTPRVLENWGMTYETLRKIRPDLIMLRAPAWGLTGPWRDRGGYAPILEQAAGMGFITGYPDDNPISPFGIADPVAGAHGGIALLLALHYRRRTGKGMLLEVPMAGSAVNIAAEAVVEYSAYGNLVERNGNRSVFAAPQGMYLSDDELPDGRKDRWVVISVATDDQWRALASAIGRSELGDNPAFVDQAGRAADQDQLDEILSDWCASRSREEIVTTLWDAGVPAAKVELGHEHQEVEQLQARGYFSRVPHPLHGPIEQIGYPVRFSAGPDQVIRRHAPLLGEHNRDVLQGMLGLSDDELEELEAARVIGTAAAQSEQSWSV